MSDINAPIIQTTPYNPSDQEIFNEIRLHWQRGFAETDKRATGKNRLGITSFDEADELFRNWIDESQWPYDALIFDPRIFTFLFEKTSRLIASKPEPRLVPREGGDVLMAKINNMLLDFQWDQARSGGTMLSKWAMMDMNCRKYGASFAVVKWRYEENDKSKPVFDGPEFKVLNNRDCAQDLTATSIENCHWFQHREYVTFHDLQHVNDMARKAPIYKNLDKLREAISSSPEAGGDTRGINWRSRNRQISKIELDPIGKDPAFKTIEIITEYRRDRWITFSPRHGVIIRDIPNPYDNWELPVVMLRYYAIDDDLYGLSELEPVKGLQKAVNALVCQYVDEINQALYSPIAIGPGVRQHTLEWGKGARWVMNNPNSDFRIVETHSQASQYFNTTYSVLVAAMMNALGEDSLGVSNTQPYSKNKTATEVQSLSQSRNARDNFQQMFLEDAMSRMLRLWHGMNQELLFTDPGQPYYILRIVGKQMIQDFMDLGLGDEMEIPFEKEILAGEKQILDVVQTEGADDTLSGTTDVNTPDSALQAGQDEAPGAPNQSPTAQDLQQSLQNTQNLAEKLMVNKHRVKVKKAGQAAQFVDKLHVDDKGHMASLYIEKADLAGDYDYKVDVQAMSLTSDADRKQARQTAVSLLITNPNVSALLQQDNMQPKFGQLLVSWLEELGWTDADRYFTKMQPNNPTPAPGMPGDPGQGNPMAALAQAMQQAQGQGQAPVPNPLGPGPGTPTEGDNPQTLPIAPGGPKLVTPFGYYNYAPPNSLQGVPVWIQQKYAAKYGTNGALPGSSQ